MGEHALTISAAAHRLVKRRVKVDRIRDQVMKRHFQLRRIRRTAVRSSAPAPAPKQSKSARTAVVEKRPVAPAELLDTAPKAKTIKIRVLGEEADREFQLPQGKKNRKPINIKVIE